MNIISLQSNMLSVPTNAAFKNTGGVAKYASIVKNSNKTKQKKVVINPVESNKILPGWVSLAKVNGITEITYGTNIKHMWLWPVHSYDELLDNAYCRTQQRYWDNDIKLKGALSEYYGRQTLDEWVEEEQRNQQIADQCIANEINEESIDKVYFKQTDSAMRRIKKNARIIMDDTDNQLELD